MPKILIYDGDCPMCVGIAGRLGALGMVDDDSRQPYQSFDGDFARRLDAAGIRNEMLVYDADSNELRSGVEGFLWLLGDTRWKRLGALLSPAPIRGLLRLIYRTTAYNRRILAPPPRGIVCACDPDPHPGFRGLFLGGMVAFDLAGAWLAGLAMTAAFGGTVAAVVTLLAVVASLLTLLALRGSPSLHGSVLAGHLLVILAGALLVAAPGLAVSLWLRGPPARILVALALGLGAWKGASGIRERLAGRARAPR